MANKSSRNISLDILKIVMAMMVVAIHTTFLYDISEIASAITVDGIFRIAVPMFLLINGFYFFDCERRKSELTWLYRVTILYIIWMIIYSPFWFDSGPLDLSWVKRFINQVVLGFFHLWYISGMIFAAIFLMTLRRLNTNFILIAIGISFFSGVLIQYIGNYHLFRGTEIDILTNKHWYHRNGLFLAFPFFAIGYLIRKHNIEKRLSIKWTRLIFAIGFICLLFETLMNYHYGTLKEGIDNIISTIIICPALLILFLRYEVLGKSKNLALIASSIYFTHVAVWILGNQYLQLSNTTNTAFVLAVSLLLSLPLIKLNKRFSYFL